ncbi:IS110 family transposase [Nocardioides panzhihuensis]|uniref:Transposase n=1 Tax=Nocardioides panzhihuensis TaxID=860243 RepID=A0A7Z0DK69_9ACTN|nr:IS110 family transposase [Nocardioides panzhihuensis]NYI77110.1 transposase [Nocardioides panzhihuensis]
MIGADSHKRTHTVVALDEVGRRLATKTVRTNDEGHLALVEWAAQFADRDDEGVRFALEDCRHLTRRLESDLLAAGHRVIRVPTRLMAGVRQSSREPGKSDPIDAEAVALAALRHADLPVAELDGPAREVKLLSDHRRDLVVQRTRIAAQVRWHLHELDPDLQVPSRGLRRQCVVAELLEEMDRFEGVVARLARGLLERCSELTDQINTLEKELRDLVRQLAPSLLDIPGCGVLSAAVIVGETAGVHRFRNKDAYARFTGTAPVPVWSGSSKGKVRLNRGGNRSMNCALHMIAVTQARGVGPGKTYLDKQLARGKDRVAGLRLLRRRLSDAVFTALRADLRAGVVEAPAEPLRLAA